MTRIILADTRGSAGPTPWLTSYTINTPGGRELVRAYIPRTHRSFRGRGFRAFESIVGHTLVTILVCGPAYEARRVAS